MTSIDFGDPVVLGAMAALALLVLIVAVVMRKGRRFAPGDVFRASRLSAGNHLFPTQVLITPEAVVRYTPRWFGQLEHSIHIAHVSSVRVETRLLFSDVFIETSGGANAVACHGHRKADAIVMKQLVERYQTAYYRHPAPPTLSVAPPPADK